MSRLKKMPPNRPDQAVTPVAVPVLFFKLSLARSEAGKPNSLCAAIPSYKTKSSIMIFSDPRAQECYDRSFAEFEGHSRESRQVHALMAVHEFVSVAQGPTSSGIHESIWYLLLPKLRPALRRWFQCSDSGKNSDAVALRNYFSKFLKEDL